MRLLTSFLLLFACSIHLTSQTVIANEVLQQHSSSEIKTVDLFEQVDPTDFAPDLLPQELRQAVVLRPNLETIADVLQSDPTSMSIALPMPEGGTQWIDLIPAKSMSMTFKVLTASGQSLDFDDQQAQHYWGILRGHNTSAVALSIFPSSVMGIFLDPSFSLDLGPIDQQVEGLHVLYYSDDLAVDRAFDCGVTAENEIQHFEQEIIPPNSALTADPDRCVLQYVEVDNDIFVDKGGLAPTTEYITGLYNQISLMFFNEQIKLRLNTMFIWDTSDPYNSDSTSDLLNTFRNRVGDGFEGDLAHLLGYRGGGGIASLNVLCRKSRGHAYSGINRSFREIPAYSWSVNVVTHELGHNLGSPHTHDCNWNGNNTAIDRCGIVAGFGSSGPCNSSAPVPEAGTVMSYCHLETSVDLALGFGPQPGDLIRDRVYNATCLFPCDPEPEVCNDFFDNDFDGLVDCEDPDCDGAIICGPCNDNAILLTIQFDRSPGETSWVLTDANGDLVERSPSYDDLEANSLITEELCLTDECFTFTINDSRNDGICCRFGDGFYSLTSSDGTVIFEGGRFSNEETLEICNGRLPENCLDGLDNDLDGFIDCEDADCEAADNCNPCDGNILALTIQLDGAPQQTSWRILDDQGSVVVDVPGVSNGPNTGIISSYCLDDGCYTLDMRDSGDNGLCCNGSSFYLLQSSTGDTLAFGTEFGAQDLTDFCINDLSCDAVNGVFMVNTVASNVKGSIQQAINCVSNDPLVDTIRFNLTAADTIFIDASLPAILDEGVVIDGGNHTTILFREGSQLFSFNADFCGARGLTVISETGVNNAFLIFEEATNFSLIDCRTNNFGRGAFLRGGNALIRDCVFTTSRSGRGIDIVSSEAGATNIVNNVFTGVQLSPTQSAGEGVRLNNANGVLIAENSISFVSRGIRSSNSTNVEIRSNAIFNTSVAINVIGNAPSAQQHLITKNSLYCNTGINVLNLSATANAGIEPPIISEATASSVSGQAVPGDIIEVFLQDNEGCSIAANECQGKTFLGATDADGDGNWILDDIDLERNAIVTATATGSDNNTSTFADCLEFVPACPMGEISIMLSSDETCPGDSIMVVFESDQAIDSRVDLSYRVNGELFELTNLRIPHTLVFYPQETTTFQLNAAQDAFDCVLAISSERVTVLSPNAEDLQSERDQDICEGTSIMIDGEEVSTAGTYFETFQTDSGCDSTVTINLGVLPEISTAEEVQLCEGSEVIVFGATITMPGSYPATFTSSTGCDSTHTVTVVEVLNIQTAAEETICEGEEIEIFGQMVSVADTYSATFPSSAGCDSTHNITLNVLEPIVTNAEVSICSGESIEVFGEMVNEADTYSASFTSEVGCDSVHNITVVILETFETSSQEQICEGEEIEIFGQMESEAGSYPMTFMAANGCDSTHTVVLSVGSPVETEETMQACLGQTIEVFGVTLQTDGSASDTFVGSNGCDSTHTINVVFQDEITTSEIVDLCEGETVTVFGQEVDGEVTLSERFQTNEGCDSVHTVQVQLLQPVSNTGSMTICEGESAMIFGNEETEAGPYTETFVGANGCDSVQTINLVVLLNASSLNTLSICEGEAIEIFGEMESTEGRYSETYMAANGCDSVAQIDLVVNALPTAGIDSSPSCSGETNGSITLTDFVGNTPFTFDWEHTDNGEDTQTDLTAGPYSVTITDTENCSSVLQLNIEQLPNPTYELDVNPIQCADDNNGQITVSSQENGILVSFNGGPYEEQTSFDGLSPAIYELSIQSAGGCIVDEVVTLEAAAAIEIEDVNVVEPGCSGQPDGSITVIPGNDDGNWTYQWSTGTRGTSINSLGVGTYGVTVTNGNGCTWQESFNLEGVLPIETRLSLRTGCGEGNIFAATSPVNGQGPYTYAWSTGASTSVIGGLGAGQYQVSVTDNNGCTVTESFTVPFVEPFEVLFQAQDASCFGASDGIIDLLLTGGVQPYDISWSNGATSEDLRDLPAGTYTYNVLSDGCALAGRVEVSEPPLLFSSVNFVPGNDGLVNATAEAFGGTPPYNYRWSNGLTIATLNGLTPGATVELTVTDANGCSTTDSYTVTITNVDQPSFREHFSVSPNPTSDLLVIEAITDLYKDYELMLFASNGTLAMSGIRSNGPRQTLSLGHLPAGVYVLTLQGEEFRLLERVVVSR